MKPIGPVPHRGRAGAQCLRGLTLAVGKGSEGTEVSTFSAIPTDRFNKVLKRLKVLRFPICAELGLRFMV